MKIMSRVLIIVAVLLLVPASSFAIGVDLGVYAGMTFAGEIKTGDVASSYVADNTSSIPISWEWGFIGHVNQSIIPLLLSGGFGGFYQYSPMEYKLATVTYDATKKTYGFDMYLQLELIPIIHPYVRYAVAIEERIDLKVPSAAGSTTTSVNKKYFGSNYFGIGVNATVFPFIRIFGEYTYNTAKVNNGVEMKSNSFHLGARFVL
jgi:hypothetical protein